MLIRSCFFLNNISIKNISLMTSVSKKAVRKLIRSVGNQINLDYRIGGKNITVEIDESKFGKKKP